MDPNLRALALGSVVRATGLSLIGPFFALYVRNVLGIGYVEIGLLLVLVSIPPLFANTIGGLLADRIGRRRLLLSSLFCEAVTILVIALAMQRRSLEGVVAGITALGVAGTLGGPALSAYIADFSRGPERTQAFTWLRVGHNVGFTLGTLAGGSLIGVIGFVPVGVIAGAFGVGAATWLATELRPSGYDLALRSGIAPGPSPSDGGASPRGTLASLRVLAKDRTFVVVCLAFALVQLVIGQWATTFPLFVFRNLGVSYGILGAGLALNGLIVVFGQTTTTRLAIGHRHTSIAILSVGLYALGFLLLGVVGEWSFLPITSFFVVVVILTVGENLSSIPFQTLPSNMAPPNEIGNYNGAFFTMTGIGQIVAVILGGLALAYVAGPLLMWGLLIAPALPAVLLMRWTSARVPASAGRA
jgi:MFS family permease